MVVARHSLSREEANKQNKQKIYTPPTLVKYIRHRRRAWFMHSPTQRVGAPHAARLPPYPEYLGASQVLGGHIAYIFGVPYDAVICLLATTSLAIDDFTVTSPLYSMCWGRSFVASSVQEPLRQGYPRRCSMAVVSCVAEPL